MAESNDMGVFVANITVGYVHHFVVPISSSQTHVQELWETLLPSTVIDSTVMDFPKHTEEHLILWCRFFSVVASGSSSSGRSLTRSKIFDRLSHLGY